MLAHSIRVRHHYIANKFPPTLTNISVSARIDRVLPKSGPVAQLGARFHGMEEVIGSIPIRSTNQFNNLNRPNSHRRTACVINPFRCFLREFPLLTAGFHPDVAVRSAFCARLTCPESLKKLSPPRHSPLAS